MKPSIGIIFLMGMAAVIVGPAMVEANTGSYSEIVFYVA